MPRTHYLFAFFFPLLAEKGIISRRTPLPHSLRKRSHSRLVFLVKVDSVRYSIQHTWMLVLPMFGYVSLSVYCLIRCFSACCSSFSMNRILPLHFNTLQKDMQFSTLYLFILVHNYMILYIFFSLSHISVYHFCTLI